MLLIRRLIEQFLRTRVVGETLVHRCHVLLLRGEDSAACRQQLVARRDTFEEGLRKRRRSKLVLLVPPAGDRDVLRPDSPPSHRDTPGSDWLSPPRSARATSCSRQSTAAHLHREPPRPHPLPGGRRDTCDLEKLPLTFRTTRLIQYLTRLVIGFQFNFNICMLPLPSFFQAR